MHLLLDVSKRQKLIGIIYKLEISLRYKGALVIVKNTYTGLGSVCIWLLINIYILIQHFSSTYCACDIHKIPCDLDNKNLQQGSLLGQSSVAGMILLIGEEEDIPPPLTLVSHLNDRSLTLT